VGQPGLLGGQLGPPGAEEGLDLVAVVHGSEAKADSSDQGCTVSTPLSSDFSVRPTARSIVSAAAGRAVGHHATGT
jgi:hypothetical protein